MTIPLTRRRGAREHGETRRREARRGARWPSDTDARVFSSPRAASGVQVDAGMTQKDELADRVQARKHELLSKYNELKADTRKEAGQKRDQIKAKLDDLEDAIKDGWEHMTDAVRGRLNKWLDKDRE
jgi:hypothetical protein